ncbi:hypothetical protein A3D06_02130 [Candidatus Roizmanbacteria bacterium RIFCSPHIGHO2_02_FULL_40_9]|uniref:Peptidase M20 dimerisation domain-containing protein n=1 Tax=Candidatus Roizmanbacteria bacterium RIFCSPHIGHO2_02_FULL_40_9 TaxID=1802042 RepID=A0A1F7HBP6_9BACT|nr:MAG: hypothetical protein A3D06_02130 [Candidatus Roizmanbacteria bacterium RIFCSPHIGHO2_02_FULL_40_9]
MKLKEKIKRTFIDLIKINEVYPHEDKIIKYVLNRFRTLNIPTKLDSFKNVIAYFPGKGEPILLNTHLDIPESVDNLDYEIDGDVIRGTGKSILGADPKSGLAVLLELTGYLKNNNIMTRPIEFVFTRGEEAGLFGALNLDYRLLKSKMGLVIDEDGPCTSIVTKAPAYYRIDGMIEGKTVHPRDWKDGLNALQFTAQTIGQLQQGEIADGVTFNIGIFTSGTARNSVPGRVEFQSELRSFNEKKLLREAKKVERCLKSLEKKDLRVHLDTALEFHSYSLEKNHELFLRLERTYGQLNLSSNYYETYGGSDANVINAHDIRVVPVGSAYYRAHQYTEYVHLEEMKDLLFFLAEFVKRDPSTSLGMTYRLRDDAFIVLLLGLRLLFPLHLLSE